VSCHLRYMPYVVGCTAYWASIFRPKSVLRSSHKAGTPYQYRYITFCCYSARTLECQSLTRETRRARGSKCWRLRLDREAIDIFEVGDTRLKTCIRYVTYVRRNPRRRKLEPVERGEIDPAGRGTRGEKDAGPSDCVPWVSEGPT
jgi:hypothetical protein